MINALKILAQLFKLHRERFLVVCHVEESPRRSIYKAVLLPDREYIPFQAKFLKGLITDTFDFHPLCTSDIRVDFAKLIEYVSNFDHLLVAIPAILIAEKLIKGFQLVKLEDTVIIQISCHEDLIDVLKFLRLQLVSCMHNKFRKIVQLHRFCIGVQMQVLVLQGL